MQNQNGLVQYQFPYTILHSLQSELGSLRVQATFRDLCWIQNQFQNRNGLKN